jgi:hypothetical protein
VVIPGPKIPRDIRKTEDHDGQEDHDRLHIQHFEDGSERKNRNYIYEGLRDDEGIHIRPEDLEENCGDNPISISHGEGEVAERHLAEIKSVRALPGQKYVNPIWVVEEQGYEAKDEHHK